ncbi:YifB family Mg chelatase-like AAA ATPase [Propioniciclava sp. MC1683]|nr:YifB family Mg chelatase-like AAA ATPase [Propioniciclava sp. MC1683]MBB1501132.1 YifB family Mg chelatase-like AAA ATPase [Propioniciclava sp. MC1683]
MRLGKARSVGLVGLQASLVDVEVSVGGGLPRTVIVGLPDAALSEARSRCRAAISSSGFEWPQHLVTINLSPASLPKSGTHFDLGIVGGILAAHGSVAQGRLDDAVLMGEVGLDGSVRSTRGVLPAVLEAARAGIGHVVVPMEQVREARLVEGITVHGVGTVRELAAVLRGEQVPERLPDVVPIGTVRREPDLADVAGQDEARWAVEIAAAGAHHLSLSGPPGVGKTLLAERLPGILPDLSSGEALEVAAIRSLSGLYVDGVLPRRPPYSAPHHSASVAALVGGGSSIARPGAISLAHRGVLFLDEVPEFSPTVLEALRIPLEKGYVELARSRAATRYPARFQLVVAANPCPCGYHGLAGRTCTCPPNAVRRYRDRLSGPILDRIDMQQTLRPMNQSYLRKAMRRASEPSAAVAARVAEARARQLHRLAGLGYLTNAEVPGPVLRHELPSPQGIDLVDTAVTRGLLSARGVDKVVRIAWTLADLAGSAVPRTQDIRAALAMRRGEDVAEVRCG